MPLGLAEQVYWRRPERVARRPHNHRPFRRRETRHLLDVCRKVHARWTGMGVATRPWFQVDRGGDFHQLLRWAIARDVWLTVRARHDRRVVDPLGTKLWEALGRRLPCTFLHVALPATEARAARGASLMVRAARVRIELKDWSGSWVTRFTLGAVLVEEVGTVPVGEAGVSWMLLTTHPVETEADVLGVVRGYTARWAIEKDQPWRTSSGVLYLAPRGGLRARSAVDSALPLAVVAA